MSEPLRLFEVEDEPAKPRKEKKRANYLTPISPVIVLQIWHMYLDTHHTGKGRKPRFNDERGKIITVAVNMFDIATVKDAIRGCALSPWHMGQNPNGTVYNSLELILRDSKHIEMFANLTVAEDNKGGFLDED